MMAVCKNCRLWVLLTERASGNQGVCRRYPPTVVFTSHELVYSQPRTDEYSSCGEFKPVDEPQEKKP